jgi:hypothetical protein
MCMAEQPPSDGADLTVAELRARAAELEITGRSSMNKEELRQAVADAEVQIGGSGPSGVAEWQAESSPDEAEAADSPADRGDDGEKPASEIPAPSLGPHTDLGEKVPPEERLEKHEQSTVDAMGLDKRRHVAGKQYGASFAKQATVYGVFIAVVVALVIGGKLAADELDQGPEVDPDKAPWSQPKAVQRPPTPIDFPRNPSP